MPDSESDWDAARLGHGPWGDPRIGRPSRSGTLLALLAVLAAVTARAPMVAVLGLLAWVTLARTADRSVTSLVMRRHERGARGSDVAVAVATSPWHLVLGLRRARPRPSCCPLFVGVCAMFASALVLTAARGTDVRTDDVLPLVVAGVFAGLTAWWGPGGASLRRGSRSIVRGLTPGEAAGQVAAGILLVVAAVVLAMTLTGDRSHVVAPHDGARVGVAGGADPVSRPAARPPRTHLPGRVADRAHADGRPAAAHALPATCASRVRRPRTPRCAGRSTSRPAWAS